MAFTWTTVSASALPVTPRERAAMAAANAADAVPGLLGYVVSEVQGAILSGGYCTQTDLDDNGGKLPPDLHRGALLMTLWDLLAMFPSLKDMQTDLRKEQRNEFVARLKLIANQEWSVRPSITSADGFPVGSWNSENKLVPVMHPVPVPSVQWPASDADYANADGPKDRHA